jgi:long-chain acyl-CoA synthetase
MTPESRQIPTILQLFATAAAANADRPALGFIQDSALRWLNWQELTDAVAAWASELTKYGVGSGDRVAQFSPNSIEWILTDLAILSIGAVHVPIHASLGPQQAADQIAHSGAKLLIVNSSEALARIADKLPPSVAVALHGELAPRVEARRVAGVGVRTTHAPAPDDLATILYTSGTTGPARGVMLTHRNLAANAIAMVDAVATLADEIRLCMLPLSHIYARTCDLYCWLVRGTRMVLAESRDTVLRDCQLARPTVINAVPYFYQKVAERVRAAGGRSPQSLRAALGGSIQRCYCGGAALPAETERFFEACDLPVMCGYGLSEAAPVITATSVHNYVPGTVGRPLDNVEVRLADDGEVLARGPSIMSGYWRNEQETGAVLHDGWLHTGDLGQWDPSGNLRIVGRKKEMIVLSTGKKVAPAQIEQLLLGSPWIEQCCVVGEGRKCLTALIVPNPETIRTEIRRRRLLVWSRRRALSHPKILTCFRQEIDRSLAGVAEFEQVARFTLLDRGFSIEAGELTPKLSLCRPKITEAFANQINSMYR